LLVTDRGAAGGRDRGDDAAAAFDQADISTLRQNGLTALLLLYISKALDLVRERQLDLVVVLNVAERQVGMLIRSFDYSRKRWIWRDGCGCASSLNT